MKTWLPMADCVLDELVRRDGRADYRPFDSCLSCPDQSRARSACICCTSCNPGHLECEECVKVRHARQACHRLQVRTSAFFSIQSRSDGALEVEWHVLRGDLLHSMPTRHQLRSGPTSDSAPPVRSYI